MIVAPRSTTVVLGLELSAISLVWGWIRETRRGWRTSILAEERLVPQQCLNPADNLKTVVF